MSHSGYRLLPGARKRNVSGWKLEVGTLSLPDRSPASSDGRMGSLGYGIRAENARRNTRVPISNISLGNAASAPAGSLHSLAVAGPGNFRRRGSVDRAFASARRSRGRHARLPGSAPDCIPVGLRLCDIPARSGSRPKGIYTRPVPTRLCRPSSLYRPVHRTGTGRPGSVVRPVRRRRGKTGSSARPCARSVRHADGNGARRVSLPGGCLPASHFRS